VTYFGVARCCPQNSQRVGTSAACSASQCWTGTKMRKLRYASNTLCLTMIITITCHEELPR